MQRSPPTNLERRMRPPKVLSYALGFSIVPAADSRGSQRETEGGVAATLHTRPCTQPSALTAPGTRAVVARLCTVGNLGNAPRTLPHNTPHRILTQKQGGAQNPRTNPHPSHASQPMHAQGAAELLLLMLPLPLSHSNAGGTQQQQQPAGTTTCAAWSASPSRLLTWEHAP